MDLNQIKRLYYTLKHLKFTQVYHQIKYRLVKPKRVATPCDGAFAQVDLADFPNKQKSLSKSDGVWSFSFLNLEQSFSHDSIDWSFGNYGMLWTYNLNYFDWLHQTVMSKELGLETLSQFYSTPADKNPIILHPYPTSLRIINTAKFISTWDIKEDWLYYKLVSDLNFLCCRLEYHLLANHLLENAFALYIGGLISNQGEFIQKGKKLLVRELKEQVLSDGMHYERSPMYHLIILERLLDALNFAKATSDDLEAMLESYAVRMTGLTMNWEDLDRIPMMQDSAYDVALTVPALLKYSKSLLGYDYPSRSNDLKDSGYRKLDNGNFSLFVNVGSIGPSYQPGHSHADELNFELFYEGVPIIVDTGISTYEEQLRRNRERSTLMHNCVRINKSNSSDVWSSFRVGSRAKVLINECNTTKISLTHDGYKPVIVNRSFILDPRENIKIVDKIKSKTNSQLVLIEGRFHLHPSINLEIIDNNSVKINQNIIMRFEDKKNENSAFRIESFQYAQGYNNLINSKSIVYTFNDKIEIKIYSLFNTKK